MRKPWGSYKVLAKGDGWLVKTITIKPLQSISLQSHEHRDEVWTIIKGECHIEYMVFDYNLTSQQTIHIRRKEKHRITNTSETDKLVLVEVQFGDILDENDITRFDDNYGRV